MGVWANLWRSEAKDWLFGRIQDNFEGDLEPDKYYLTVMLRSLRIPNVRVGFNRFYGTVQSYSRLPHLSGTYLEFAAVTTPAALHNVAKKDTGNFAMGSHRLVGPAPYRGGDLELEVGLFAIKSQDMLAPFLELLEGLSKAAGVSVFSIASPFVDPLKKGVELLTGSPGDCGLEIGLATTFDKPAPGRYFVARIDRLSEDGRAYSVDKDYRLINPDGKPVVDAPYLVFSIECDAVRNDWYMIPVVSTAYFALNKAIEDGLPFKVITSYKEHFRRILFSSPDILPGHAEQIIDWVSAKIDKVVGSEKTSGGGENAGLPPLESFALLPL